jgi:hypothetical protein
MGSSNGFSIRLIHDAKRQALLALDLGAFASDPAYSWQLSFRGRNSILNNKRTLQVNRGLGSMMFNPVTPIAAQIVEAETVLIRIKLIQ